MTLQERNKLIDDLWSSMPIYFAYNHQNMLNQLAELGATEKDVRYIGGSYGFILEKDQAKVEQTIKEIKRITSDWRKDEKNLMQELVYEFANHECCWSEDPHDVIRELDLELNKSVCRCINKAWKMYCKRTRIFYAPVYGKEYIQELGKTRSL